MRALLSTAAVCSLVLALGACRDDLKSGPDYEVTPSQESEVSGAAPGGNDDDHDHDDGSSRPSDESNHDSTPEAASPPMTGDAPMPDASAPVGGPGTYSGTLSATDELPFSATCRYTVTLTNVRVVVTVDGDKIVDASVKAEMVEKLLTGCSRPPIPLNTLEHALDKNAEARMLPPEGSVDLPMFRKGGSPATNLLVRLVRTGEGFDASLTWKRVDNVASSLRWTQRAKVAIQAQ